MALPGVRGWSNAPSNPENLDFFLDEVLGGKVAWLDLACFFRLCEGVCRRIGTSKSVEVSDTALWLFGVPLAVWREDGPALAATPSSGRFKLLSEGSDTLWTKSPRSS
jgi:hypothetical protein